MRKQKKRGDRKERIWNIPNLLCFLRIALAFVLIYLVFAKASILTIVIVFSIAAITDALDGFIARKFNLKTELGRKLDMFADRILMLSVVIALISYLALNNLLAGGKFVLILMLMSREIISAPFFIISFFAKNGNTFPQARKIAKLITLLQGISLPMILLGWQIAVYFSILTFAIGIVSGILYAYDSVFNGIRKR